MLQSYRLIHLSILVRTLLGCLPIRSILVLIVLQSFDYPSLPLLFPSSHSNTEVECSMLSPHVSFQIEGSELFHVHPVPTRQNTKASFVVVITIIACFASSNDAVASDCGLMLIVHIYIDILIQLSMSYHNRLH